MNIWICAKWTANQFELSHWMYSKCAIRSIYLVKSHGVCVGENKAKEVNVFELHGKCTFCWNFLWSYVHQCYRKDIFSIQSESPWKRKIFGEARVTTNGFQEDLQQEHNITEMHSQHTPIVRSLRTFNNQVCYIHTHINNWITYSLDVS